MNIPFKNYFPILTALLFWQLFFQSSVQAQCPTIQIVDLKDTPGFPQTDDLNVCGAPDTLSLLMFTDAPGQVQNFEFTVNMVSGMRYAGFEETHYGGCTSLINTDSDINSPSFLGGGLTCGDIFVANIGVTADCAVDLANNDYLIEIEYSYLYFPPTGSPINCTGTQILGDDFNGALKESVLNMASPAPIDVTVTALGTPACQSFQISQDGLQAYLSEFNFAVCGLDLGASSPVSVSTMTANGIDILAGAVYNSADTSLIANIDNSFFAGNSSTNATGTADQFDTAEKVSVEICYEVANCPAGANLPFTYKASYGCFDEVCQIASQASFLKVVPTGSLTPTITATLDNGITICGTDATVSATVTNPNTDTDQNVYTNLSIGFQACGMEAFNITDVMINGVSVPPLFMIIGSDIDIDLSMNTDPTTGLSDYDGDGFFDDLPGGSAPLDIIVKFGLACGVGTDGGCPEINCDNVQFYVKGETNCGNAFQGFPSTSGFNLQYGQEDVSNGSEVDFNTAGTVVGYDFGNYSNDGAPVSAGASEVEVEFCYQFAQQNIADCPSGGETKMLAHFAGAQIFIEDLEVVAGTVMMDDGSGYAAVSDALVTYTQTSTATATLEINAGNNNPNLCYKYTLKLDDCHCGPTQYVAVDQQIVSVCSDCTPDCEIVKGCRSTLLKANPECSPCPCVAEYFPTKTERKNLGYIDKEMTRKITRDELLAGNAVDLGRFMPGDTLWHQGYWELNDEDILFTDPQRWHFDWYASTISGSAISGETQAALPLTWEGGAMQLNELKVENPDGTIHIVDLSLLAGCANGGTRTYYNSLETHFLLPWGDNPEDEYESAYQCSYNAWEGYNNDYTQFRLLNYARMSEVNAANSSLATRHDWGSGDCLNEFIETYGIVSGTKVHFDWCVPLIKNPLREMAKILGVEPVEENIARIIPVFAAFQIDEIAGTATTGAGSNNAGCQTTSTYNVSCPGGLKSETNIILDNCGGTIEHEFVVSAFAGDPGDEWFTHEYRPLMELHDLELPIFSPLAYCAGAQVEQNGIITPVVVDSTINMSCSPVGGYSDALCSVDVGSEGAIVIDLYDQGFHGLGIGLGNCDTIKLSYNYCMICPAPLTGLLDYQIKSDWCYNGGTPSDCNISSSTFYNPNNTGGTTTLGDEANAQGYIGATWHNVNYWEIFGLDTLYCKIDDTQGIVFIDESGVTPTLPVTASNANGIDLIASGSPGSSIEVKEVEFCNPDPMNATGFSGYVALPSSVLFEGAYLDAAGTMPLVTTVVSDDGQEKKYQIDFLSDILATTDCISVFVKTTLLFCPAVGSLSPEICVGASSGCSPAEVRAAIGGSGACSSSEVCYAYISGEADLQTEWFSMPVAPALCETFTLHVRTKNVKELTLLDLDPNFSLPFGLSIVPNSWEVAFPGGTVDMSGNFGAWTSVSDPDIVSGMDYSWSDDALWNSDINMNGLPGVSSTLDSNTVAFRFQVATNCDEFLSGAKVRTETLATDPCGEEPLTSGDVESPAVIIDGANPADYAQILAVGSPSDLYCGGLNNTFGLTALNVSEYATTDSVITCITIPGDVLTYTTGSISFTNGFVPAWVTETPIGDDLQVCVHSPVLSPGEAWSLEFEAAMKEDAPCGEIEIGADIKSVVEDVACSTGSPATCDVFVQNSLNPVILIDLKPPLKTEDIRVSADCSASVDPVQVCYEIDLTNPGPDYTGNVRVGIHDDVTGNSILDSFDAELNGMDHAVTILNGDTITITACLDIAAIQSCPIIVKTTYETSCACDSEEVPYQTLAPSFIEELEDCTVLCTSQTLDLATCGDFEITFDPAEAVSVADDGMGNLSISVNSPYGETSPINITVTGTQGECEVSVTKQIKSAASYVPTDLVAEICEDNCVDLDLGIPSNLVDGATITWTPSLGLSDPTSPDPEACSLTATQVYNVEINFLDACIYNIEYTVNYNPISSTTITSEEFCLDYEKGLVIAPTGFTTYEWYSLQSGFEVLESVTTTNEWNGPSVGGDYFLKAFTDGILCPAVSNVVTISALNCFDLELDKTICNVPTNPGIGDTISFCIEVCNIGDPSIGLIHDANDIEVEDSWPPDVEFIDYTSSTGSFVFDTPYSTWQIPLITAGTCETIEIRAVILNGGVIENIAQISDYGGMTDVDSGEGNDNGDQSEDEEALASIEIVLANIGDLLFIDADGDGIQDPSETGVAGATVTLFDATTGLPVGMVVTDANGNYLFEDLPSGDYYIEFDLSTARTPGAMDYLFTTAGTGDGTNDSEADANGTTPSFSFDATLGDDLTHDAGVIPAADLGDFVWIDTDGDGVQDAGEVGVNNVQVILFDATTGLPLDTVYTDPSGMYLFENLPAGDYEIVFDYSTASGTQDFVFTDQNSGTSDVDSNVDATGSTGTISFDPLSGDDLTIDAGLVPVADIGNYVWIDADMDGVQDPTEAGLENVQVILYDFNTGLPLDTVYTDANGAYLFEDIPEGEYYVGFDPSTSTLGPDFSFSGEDTGNGANDSDADTNGFTDLIDFDPSMGDDLTIDAGLFPTADIGDTVWIDANGDGIEDPTEMGVAGVTVTLYDAVTGAVIATTTTDANGNYLFEDVPSGDYQIGYDTSTATTPGVSEYAFTQSGADSEADAVGQGPAFTFDASTGDDLDHDAGIVPTANIGNYVWIDSDGDGIQDANEDGVQNVEVTLFDSVTGLPVATVFTDANGEYLFEDIPAGDYYIEFDASGSGIQMLEFTSAGSGTGENDSEADPNGVTPSFTFDPTMGDDLTHDAGIIIVEGIGNYVWVDTDGDGIQDPGEMGVEGVTVTLYDGNTGAVIATVLTDANGEYLFDNVPAGNYNIGFDLSTNTSGVDYPFTETNAGNGANDSDADANGFTMNFDFDPSMGADLSWDAGIVPSADIGDTVWIDANGDGIQDPTEVGVAGVTVTLFDATTGAVIGTAITDANGNYLFEDMPSGDYYLEYDTSTATTPGVADYPFTQSGIDSEAGADGQGPSFSFDATMGDDLDHDAGIVPSANIGNYVWIDSDGDGIQDANEDGVQNVEVTLFDSVTGLPVATVFTDANGEYLFEDIPAGDYYIEFDASGSGVGMLEFTSAGSGTGENDSEADPDGVTPSFTFDPTMGDDLTHDAGIILVEGIGNYVWVDADGDGIQDPGEMGVEGVTVTLYDGNTGAVIATVLTDANGEYLFENIPAGNYNIGFDLTTNTSGVDYPFTETNAGNGANDSDADANGFTMNFDFDPSMGPDLSWDAGIVPSADIGDTVWIDANGDGIQDPTEVGVAGVTVTLFDATTGAVIGTAITDANGNYLFEDIPSGDYYIEYDTSTSTTPGVADYPFTQSGTDSEAGADGQGPSFSFDATMGDDLDHDAGIVPSADIGNFVWIDTDGDGIQDAGEIGVSNVGVTLFDSNGVAVATVFTDTNGEYLFEDVPAGEYYIEFDVVGSSAEDSVFTMSDTGSNDAGDSDADSNGTTMNFIFDPSMGDNLTIDAGVIPVNDIGDFVWIDTDGDGIQDANEIGVAGVTVTLYDATTGAAIGTAITDANGEYLFEDIPMGDYYINFDLSTNTSGIDYPFTEPGTGNGVNDSDADVDGNTATFSFDPTVGPDLSWDAGVVPSANIGDTVWIDADGDGIQDPSEMGAAGVTVTLIDATTGMVIATAITDANGNYLFEDIPSGDYSINYDLSTSTTPGVADYPFTQSGLDSEADEDGQGPSFSFDATMGDDLEHDAGISPVANIGDYVWIDTDGDGIQDANEMGLENVTVTLYDALGNVIATVFTDVDGGYLFEDIPAGEYSIGFDTSSSNAGDYEFSPMGNGDGTNDSEADASGQTPNFVFDPASGDDLTHDTGVIPVADLGDTVFIDADGDGVQDPGETGLEGVTVNLYDANTGAVIATVLTDANGNYLFEDLPAGDYYVGFDASTSPDLAGDFEFSPTGNGNGSTDSDAGVDGFTSVISFDPTMGDNLTIDAGIIPISNIGDTVWVDTDGDGIQDPGETGVEGVTVTLYDAITGLPIATVVTDANGNYLFEDIPSGDYYIEFDVTTSEYGEDFTFATQNSGTPGEDSDADATGTTAVFNFDASQGDLLTIDAGIQPVPMISNIKYIVSNTINADGDLEVVFGIGVMNTGVVDLTNLSLQDDLATQLGAGFMNVVGNTLMVNTTASINPSLNPSYNGSSDVELFIGSNADLLEPGQEIDLEITVIIDPLLAAFPLQNQTFAAGDGMDQNGNVLMDGLGNTLRVSDASDSGRMHGDDNAGEPGDAGTSDDPTLLECFPANIIVTGEEIPVCYGEAAYLTVVTDYTNVQYQWREEGTTTILSTSDTPDFAPLTTTNYEVTVVVFDDVCVYDLIDTITVVILDEINISIVETYVPNADCSPSDLSFEVLQDGNPSSFVSYNWTGPNGFTSIEELPLIANAGPENNGSYTVDITDDSGCIASETIQVNDVITPSVTDPLISSTGPACEGEAITLTTGVQSGINVSYVWTMPSATNVVGQGTNEITIFPLDEAINAGDYSVEVSVDGCTLASQIFTVEALTASIAAPTATTTAICEGDNLFLEANSPTGVSFAWSGPSAFTSDQRNPVVTDVSEANNGIYTLTTTNVQGCTSVTEVNVASILPPAETPTIAVNGPNCAGDDLVLTTSTAGTNFEWIGPLGASQATLMMQGLTTTTPTTTIDENNASYLSGDWRVQVTDANGCTSISEPISVGINDVPLAVIINDGDVCEGDVVKIAANTVADATYAWYDADPAAGGILISQNQSFEMFDLAPNTYTYFLQVDANGCPSEVAMTSITVNANPTTLPNFTYTTNTDCSASDLSLQANATGAAPYTYNWSGPNGFTSTEENPTIPGAAALNNGSYTLQVVDANGCQSEVMSLQVDGVENSVPEPVITSSGPACDGETITLSIPAYNGTQVSYMWTTPSGFVNITGQTSNVLIISPVTDAVHTGDYSVTVMIDDCTVTSDAFSVNIFDSPSAAISATMTSICPGGDLELFANAINAVSYAWSGPNGFTSNASDVILPNVSIANNGTYTVIVTSQSGCSVTDTYVIDNITEEGTTPTLLMDMEICEGEDILLSTTAPGAQYEWISPLGDSPTGIVELTTSTGNTTIAAANAAYLSGNWTVRVTDASGCSVTSEAVSLLINDIPVALARNNGPICEDSGDIQLIGNEVPNATYAWYQGDPVNGGTLFSTDMSPMLFSPSVGVSEYYLVVTQDGCASPASMTEVDITAKPESTPQAVYNLSPDCALEDLQLDANAVGSGPFEYLWTGPNSFTSTEANPSIANITEEGNGSYTVLITDAFGCENFATVELNNISNPEPQPVVSTTGVSCDDGAIVLSTQAYFGTSVTYTWTTPSGTVVDISGLETNEITISPVDVDIHDGDYTLTVEVDGCTLSSAPFNLEVLEEPIAAEPTAIKDGVCVGEDILLESEVAADYLWSGPNGFTSTLQFPVIDNPSLAAAGTYFLTVFNEQGCQSDPVSIDITVDVQPAQPTLVVIDNIICDTEDIVLRTSSICDEYQWIGPGGSSVNTLSNPLLTTTLNTTSIPQSDEAYAQGMWSLICINGNGCASPMSAELMVSIIDVEAPRPATDQFVACASEEVTLSAGTGYDAGTEFYWYNEDPASGSAILISNQPNPTVLEQINSGNYTYWLQIEQEGCLSEAVPVTLSVPDAPVLAATNDGTECISSTTDVNLSANVTNGTAPFSYEWSGPNGFSSVEPVTALPNAANSLSGVYVVRVTDANGCTAVTETIVDVTVVPDEPVLQYASALCTGSEFVINAPLYEGEEVMYFWTGPNGTTQSGAYPEGNEIVIEEIAQSDAGQYEVYVVVDGCTSTTSSVVPVFVNDPPAVAPSNDGVLCADIVNDLNLSANVTGGQGPYTFNWQGPNGFISQAENPQLSNLGVEASGTYTLYVSDANGCESVISSTSVSVSELPATPTINVSSEQVCENGQLILSTQAYNSSNVTYTWILSDGTMVDTDSPVLLIDEANVDLHNGFVSVMVTINGCTSYQASQTYVEVSAQPNAPALANSTSETEPACEGFDIQLSTPFMADATYIWVGPNGFTSTLPSPSINEASMSDVGTYTLIVEVDGCYSEAVTTEVYVEEMPDIPVADNEGPACVDMDITLRVLNADPELLYTWFRVIDNFEVGTGAVLVLPTASVSDAGGYYVIGSTDDCFSSASNITDVVVNAETFTNAYAGEDDIICQPNYVIGGNSVTDGEGFWTQINASGQTEIVNPELSETIVRDLEIGANEFVWTVSNGACENTSTDTVVIIYNADPIVSDDSYALDINEMIETTVLENDQANAEFFTVSVIEEPLYGELIQNTDGTFSYVPNENYTGNDSYTYELCHDFCEDKCVQATVYFNIGEGTGCFAPTIITPNGDGVNDSFTIPCLSSYENSSMCIFNRWGDEIYRSDNYRNEWEGTYKEEGSTLPTGTYYYILQVNDGNNTVMTGYVFVQR